MSDALHGAGPDERAECPRCGALVRVAVVARHDRDHEWDDDLEARVTALERGAGGRIADWPSGTGDDPEPAPEPVRDAAAPDEESTGHRFG